MWAAALLRRTSACLTILAMAVSLDLTIVAEGRGRSVHRRQFIREWRAILNGGLAHWPTLRWDLSTTAGVVLHEEREACIGELCMWACAPAARRVWGSVWEHALQPRSSVVAAGRWTHLS
jgi:hypothetical protein